MLRKDIMEETEENDKKTIENISVLCDGSDKCRMWAAITFSVMLIIVGIPLWWRTTEVYRASLPYHEISLLKPSTIVHSIQVLINTRYPTLYISVSRDLKIYFKNLTLFNLDIKAHKLDLENISVNTVEQNNRIHPKLPGQILLIEVPHIDNNKDILISSHRIIYFVSRAKSYVLSQIIIEWMLEEEEIKDKINSLIKQNETRRDGVARLRASLNYDILFTVIHADPVNVHVHWDVKSSIQKYFNPLLKQISSVGNHKAKSQWLFFMYIGSLTTYMAESNEYVIKYEDLPHIITPLEKRLGSGVSAVSCVHMVLYIARCSEAPLSFLSENGLKTAWMVSPSWGAVQVLNPSREHCENGSTLEPDQRAVMATFVSQFHALLGFRSPDQLPGVGLARGRGPLLLQWQLDSLYRMRCLEQLTSSSLTLQSLAKLLGEISNIVINEEVASSIEKAVGSIARAEEELKRGNLAAALAHSSAAFSESEKAFSDPSLLALLYFPDDQKYAVYIPLFLPIMIPVLMSLKPIYKWLTVGQLK